MRIEYVFFLIQFFKKSKKFPGIKEFCIFPVLLQADNVAIEGLISSNKELSAQISCIILWTWLAVRVNSQLKRRHSAWILFGRGTWGERVSEELLRVIVPLGVNDPRNGSHQELGLSNVRVALQRRKHLSFVLIAFLLQRGAFTGICMPGVWGDSFTLRNKSGWKNPIKFPGSQESADVERTSEEFGTCVMGLYMLIFPFSEPRENEWY